MMKAETVLQAKPDDPVGQLTDLASKLSASIQFGNKEGARELLEQLLSAQPKLDVNISVPVSDNVQRKQENEFSVRVHVEDREATGGMFNLKVKSCDTVLDLKRRFLLQWNLPIEVQRWIIGKRIRDDKCSLYSCGVKGPGATLFLYIVTAHSAGLTRENFEANMMAYSDSRYPMPMNPQLSSSSDGSMLGSNLAFIGKSISPSLLDSQVLPDNIDKSSAFMTSSWPNQDTKSWGVGVLDSLPKPADVVLSVAPTSSTSLSKGQNADNGIGSASSPEASHQLLQQSLLTTPNDLPTPALAEAVGWNCPVCTFRNVPTRPGCSMCSASRPESYVVPPDYQMTPEEEIRLAVDEENERKTREPGALGLTFDQEQENMLLQMVQEGLDPKFLEVDEDGFQMLPQSVLHEQSFSAVTPDSAGSVVPRGPTQTQEPQLKLLGMENICNSSDEDGDEDEIEA